MLKETSMRNFEAIEAQTPYDVEARVQTFHWWFVVRRKLLRSILSSLDLPHGCLAVDVGCGAGSNLTVLEFAGFNVIGLDRSFYALSLAQKKQKFPLLNGDVNNLPIRGGSIGLIVAMDILEHLDNDTTSIRTFYEALKEEGTLILTVPAFKFLWGIQDEVTGHKRRYSRREVVNKLQEAGFRVIKSSYFNFLLFFPILIVRRMIYLLGVKIESENEVNLPLINFVLKTIFSFEAYILKYLSFPFGVSVLCIAKKMRLE